MKIEVGNGYLHCISVIWEERERDSYELLFMLISDQMIMADGKIVESI